MKKNGPRLEAKWAAAAKVGGARAAADLKVVDLVAKEKGNVAKAREASEPAAHGTAREVQVVVRVEPAEVRVVLERWIRVAPSIGSMPTAMAS